MINPWKLAFVVPRYGDHILGGAETLVRGFAEQAVAAGLAQVDIFTTCATSHLTWHNDLPAGTTTHNGVTLHRFPIDHTRRNLHRYTELHIRLIQDDRLNIDDQLDWLHHSAHSPALYQALAQHAQDYDFVLFAPYLFGSTLYGSAVCPDRAILWPCLHDESYAYMDVIGHLFNASLGLVFNALPEMKLAERLYGKRPGQHLLGYGFGPNPARAQADPARFRQRHHLHEPFMLYAGRLERPKNVDVLLDYFMQYKRDCPGPLKLVLLGTGPVGLPTHPDIIGLGFVDEAAKMDAYAAASIFCQPSTNESLSIVIMEAWLSGVPVLVHGRCPVTRHHVTHSNGGLHFSNYDEFNETVSVLMSSPTTRRAMGQNGKRYVETVYNWPAALQRLEAALLDWRALQRARSHAPVAQSP